MSWECASLLTVYILVLAKRATYSVLAESGTNSSLGDESIYFGLAENGIPSILAKSGISSSLGESIIYSILAESGVSSISSK